MNADNLIVLNGRLTKEVDLSYSQTGTAFSRFTVAVTRSRTDQNGERKSDFHNCVAFGKTAETIANYFSRGSMIGIVGELQDNNYEKDGVTHYSKQIVVDCFGFREKKKDSQGNGQMQQNQNYGSNQNFNPNQNSGMGNQGFSGQQGTLPGVDPFADGSPIDILDSDLPF